VIGQTETTLKIYRGAVDLAEIFGWKRAITHLGVFVGMVNGWCDSLLLAMYTGHICSRLGHCAEAECIV